MLNENEKVKISLFSYIFSLNNYFSGKEKEFSELCTEIRSLELYDPMEQVNPLVA
jgi:hypothetical protein